MRTSPCIGAGVIRRSGPWGFGATPSAGTTSSMPTPSARSASIIRVESRECSGRWIVDGPSARAARTSSRFVSDFEPGRETSPCNGPVATGAIQGPAVPVPLWECVVSAIGSQDY